MRWIFSRIQWGAKHDTKQRVFFAPILGTCAFMFIVTPIYLTYRENTMDQTTPALKSKVLHNSAMLQASSVVSLELTAPWSADSQTRRTHQRETSGSSGTMTPDIFNITLIHIEYIMELKVGGLRFIIPTNIAPRYGATEPIRIQVHDAK